TGGRPHHPEPARPAVYRYSDELHVSKCGVVVLRHADPVLFDLSPALLNGVSCWTVVVSVHRMCGRIFCALRFAGSLAAKRIVGTGRLRDLSIAGIGTRDVAGNVAYAIARAPGMVPSSRRGIRNRLDPLPCGTPTLPRTLRLHLCRFRHWHMLHAGDCRH